MEDSVDFPQQSAYKNPIINTQVFDYSANYEDRTAAIRLVNSQKTIRQADPNQRYDTQVRLSNCYQLGK